MLYIIHIYNPKYIINIFIIYIYIFFYNGLTQLFNPGMIRWMCGISMKVRRTNEELRRLVGVEPITAVIRRGRLRWYEHVMRTG